MKHVMLKSPVDKTSSEARRILSNITFRKEVGNASALHPKRAGNGISRLHADSDACKGSTDTPKNATQGCSAALKLSKRFCEMPAPMATDEDGKFGEKRRTQRHSVVGVC